MYHKTVLDNGVRILSERLDHFRSISLGIWVNVGSREEKEGENGISHFIEHMTFKGTRHRTSLEIAKQLDAIGGFSNAFTGKENTCFHSKVLDKHFVILADILSDIFLNPLFNPEDIERERQVILQEINMVEDTPDELIHVLFNRQFWMNHSLGLSILGTDRSVSSLHQIQLIDYIKRYYSPDRIVIAAAGGIDHQELVDYLRPLFEPLSALGGRDERISPTVYSGISSHYKELEQVHICIGGKAPHLSSKRRFAGTLFSTILGGNMSSRLFQEIRENRGLAYSIYSFLSAYIDTGLFGIYVATGPSSVNEVLQLINKEVRKIQRGGLTESDLSAAREHIIGGILLGSESSDNRMMRLARNEFVFKKFISYEELVAGLERVTVDEVVDSALDTFKDKEVSLTTLGSIREDDLDLGCLQFFDT